MKHVCGQCNKIFATELEYLKHRCPKQSSQDVTKLSEGGILAAVKAAREAKKK